jgi:hypothetical protein
MTVYKWEFLTSGACNPKMYCMGTRVASVVSSVHFGRQ